MKRAVLLTILQISHSFGAFILCYFPFYARYRDGDGKIEISDIDPRLCTHLMYSFAHLDPNSYHIKPADQWNDIEDGGYKKAVALKNINKNLKVMIVVGGWTDSNDGTNKYSNLVANDSYTSRFVRSAVDFLRLNNFDGLDLHWMFPETEADKIGLPRLVAALKKSFSPFKFLLSVTVRGNTFHLEKDYDLKALNYTTDFVNVLAFDMHGPWGDEVTIANHHAPLQQPNGGSRENNVAYLVDYITRQGYQGSRTVLGIPFSGKSWTLNSSIITPPAPASGPGEAGPFTATKGLLGYNEICSFVKTAGWKVFPDPESKMGPFALGQSPERQVTWVGYDDVAMVTKKAQYVITRGLAGALAYDISTDDFRNNCGDGTFPLLRAINEVLVRSKKEITGKFSCRAREKPLPDTFVCRKFGLVPKNAAHQNGISVLLVNTSLAILIFKLL